MRLSHAFILGCCLLSTCLVVATAASAQNVSCSSDDMGKHYCRVNTSNGVTLVHQRSGSACTMGVSWGYDNSGIWVDHGCRADFSLNGSGNGGYNNGGNSGGGNSGGGYNGGSAQSDLNNALLMCKNSASQRLPGVPLAYISVYRGTDPNPGNYMINFHSQPPNQRQSSGFCIVSKNGQLRSLQFDNNSGGNTGGNNNGGNTNGGASPNDAMQLCKDAASARMSNVPRAYISVYRATDADPETYLINFRAQPPSGPGASGFCTVSKNGQLRNLQFDSNSGSNQGGSNQGGGNYGGANSGGQSSQDIMRACKNAVSQRMPNIPLAYIEVNPPRVNGGSMLSNFRTNLPNGPHTSGSCDVFKNGHVNLQFNN